MCFLLHCLNKTEVKSQDFILDAKNNVAGIQLNDTLMHWCRRDDSPANKGKNSMTYMLIFLLWYHLKVTDCRGVLI